MTPLLHTYLHTDLLPAIWFFTIALEIALYLLLDGADLGIGIRSLFAKNEAARARMIRVIGPIWDANETWLVVAAGTLFGAFPLAYGIMLSSLYIPIMFLIFALILRAISFGFYEASHKKERWAQLFGLSSLLAAIGQGAVAGGLVSGISVTNDTFTGHALDWATPLTFVLIFVIVLAYLCTGSAYLHRKHSKRHRWLYPLALGMLALGFICVSLSMLPFMIPPSITIYHAAASPKTLTFMLYGIGPLIPIIFAYNIYLYRVFREHTGDDYGYG